MADAICGPSNALQQFKQHSSVDRSLQQDRLSTRPGAAQGFRSQKSAAAPIDPDFEAFQSAFQPAVHEQSALPLHPAAQFNPPAGPSWATDFQHLHISPPAPSIQQPAFQSGSRATDWAQGFREHFAENASHEQTSSPSRFASQWRGPAFANSNFQPSLHHHDYSQTQHLKSKAPVVAEQFDDAAFEQAFEQAREDAMLDVEEDAQDTNIEQMAEQVEAATEQEATQMLKETAREADLQPMESVQTTIHRIHSSDVEYQPQDAIMEQEEEGRQAREDDDALAMTAEQLLQKVEHNQSEKFKNSQFLGLMRRLRDREVRVQGDEMVETANAISSSNADATLNESSTNSQRVYYDKRQPVPLPVQTLNMQPSEYNIPPIEQDRDLGRINANDGQEVVDLLRQPGPLTEDIDYDPRFAEDSPIP